MHLVRKNPSKQTLKSRRGFTLAEVMIAAAISVIAMIGLLGTSILSYKYALMARYKERATNALLTIADQFQNSPVRDHSKGNNYTSSGYKTLFQVAATQTGSGLAWDVTRQCFVYPNSTGTSTDAFITGIDDKTGLHVPLNTVSDTTSTAYYAHITRVVSTYSDLYPEAGTTASTSNGDPEPSMIEAIFYAEYPFDQNGNKITSFLGDQKISIKVLRTITKTDVLQ